MFREAGWDKTKPNLIGYTWEDKVQLMTGSHRWGAADEVGLLVPVKIFTYEYIQSIWGTDEWVSLIKHHT
jgi:hypothetical protein